MAIPTNPGALLPSTVLAAPTGSFSFPREHSYPPFFTRQPIASTLHAQLQKWSLLILAYCREKRLFKISLVDQLGSDLFSNGQIGKAVNLAFAREIVEHMRSEGRADWITPATIKANYEAHVKVPETDRNVAWVYWKNVDEWGNSIAEWVDETGQKHTVLTLYEITESEATLSREWHGMDEELLRRALASLVKRGRAQVFGGTGGDEGLGVKFF